MKYPIYKTQIDQLKSTNTGRKYIRSICGKKGNPNKHIEEIFELSSQPNTSQDASIGRLVLQENHWVDNASPVIFFDSKSLAESLYKAKFDFENNFNVAPPFKTFSISFAPNTVINDVEVKTALISIMTVKEFSEMYKEPLTINGSSQISPDELCITVNCDRSTKTKGQHWINSFFAYLPDYSETIKKTHLTNLPSQGSEELRIITKIALSLCVYHSATDLKKLVDGYPKSALSLPKDKNKVSYTASVLHSSQKTKTGKSERKVNHRIPHYRNLRAKRFYQNKYKNMRPGTRWVFVKEVDPNGSMNTLLN